MKKVLKAFAVMLAAVMLLLTFVACVSNADNPNFATVMTINGTKITAGEYLYYLSETKESIRSLDTVRAASEYWKLPFGDTGMNNQEYAIYLAKNKAINRVILEQKMKEYGFKLSESDLETMQTLMDYYIMGFDYEDTKNGTKLFKEALKDSGLTYDIFYSMQATGAMAQTMIDELYSAGKSNEITQDEIKQYYDDNYVRVKHILISVYNSDGKKMEGEELEDAKARADKAYERATSGQEEFDSLVTELSEDSGSKSYPDGYIFTENETSFPVEFNEASVDMQVGEIRMIETAYGYHIMKKYDINETSTLFDIKHDDVYNEMAVLRFQEMFDGWVEEADVVEMEDELAKIKFEYISTSYDTTVTATPTPSK